MKILNFIPLLVWAIVMANSWEYWDSKTKPCSERWCWWILGLVLFLVIGIVLSV